MNREDLVDKFASCKNGSRTLTFCQTAEPHDVRLEDVDGAVLDELAEAAMRAGVSAGLEWFRGRKRAALTRNASIRALPSST